MWHVSISLQDRKGRKLDEPDLLEREAIAALEGVGGAWERWRVAESGIGHLHVPVLEAERAMIPPGQVVTDAGETGPERPRTVGSPA